ncbi:MAG TPA: helix-turn-helix domain-containing protein [Bryobacteraceae bacterium]|nr:helix-turn-helix domain-containing protein [Bryobacteraceae bacterium]
MDDFKLSPPERMILEALQVAPDLPKIPDRALILLRAAEGMRDEQIAAELQMRRKDVRHWRNRFAAHGIRGLWDQSGPGPDRKATPEKKQAVVWDTLYGLPYLRWSTRLLAQKHELNPRAVYRIWKEHGIQVAQYGLIDIRVFRVFADPLFGVTVSSVAGLFCGSSGVLALQSVASPFAALSLVTADAAAQSIAAFLDEVEKLAHLRYYRPDAIDKLRSTEAKTFPAWLDAIAAHRAPQAEIHLLADKPTSRPLDDPAHQQWLTKHPQFRVHYAPITTHLIWATLVKRCFQVISALPMQAGFIQTVQGMTRFLQGLSDPERLGILAVTPS